jgi:tetratricopeptide (TPR) repeat protein
LRSTTGLLLAALLLLAACGPTAAVMPPAVTPGEEDRFFPHPLTGRTLAPPVGERFEAAYRYAMAGNEAEADRIIAELRQRNPDVLVPSLLLDALIDVRAGRLDDAVAALQSVREREPDNAVARVYEAEIAFRQKQTRIAYDLYRQLPGVPHAAERLRELEGALFNELYAAAQTAPDTEAIRLLREALTFNAGAVEPRILLAQKLVTQRSFDEARREVEPLLDTAPDRPEVQEILAEVDIGRGRYQEAIVRLDRLARRTRDARYQRRLDEVKSEWSAANMPSHYRAAMESSALTRAELAVLLYWTVPSIRFAQNLGVPPIAVDVQDVSGREEIIRAIAMGLYEVDPVTRRVSPYRTVSASRFSAHLARVLVLRGAACARGVAQDKVLSACGVEDPAAGRTPDTTITGREALRYLEQLARKL